MRRVRIKGTPPLDWVQEAEAATQELRNAADQAARDAIITANEGLWRDDRIRNWLLGQFNNKCWYSEAQDTVSSIHVDHYRPKGRVKQEAGADHYDAEFSSVSEACIRKNAPEPLIAAIFDDE